VQIRVDNLQGRSRNLEINEPVDAFPALVALSEQGDVVFSGHVKGQLKASEAGDMVRIEGHVTVNATFVCSRCLTAVDRCLDVPVTLCYQKLELHRDTVDQDEVELTLRDLEVIPFQGDEIDTRPEIAQELIMALPQTVLCRDTCAGLCPVCGNDRNVSQCGCETTVLHEGLARLKDFKVDRD
jgi:uncharacterized protein